MSLQPCRPLDPIRQLIRERLDEIGVSDSQLSKMIGRDPSYISQYFRRGSPAFFEGRTRRAVAEVLGIDEAQLMPKIAGAHYA